MHKNEEPERYVKIQERGKEGEVSMQNKFKRRKEEPAVNRTQIRGKSRAEASPRNENGAELFLNRNRDSGEKPKEGEVCLEMWQIQQGGAGTNADVRRGGRT